MRKEIDSLISKATKSKELDKLKVLRLIKAELLKASKSGHDFDDNKILLNVVIKSL